MVEMETQAADCVNAGIRMKKDLGFLHLGKIDQEYIQDPDPVLVVLGPAGFTL